LILKTLFSVNAQVGTVVVGLAYFIGTILSKPFVNMIGQKPAILFQFIIISASLCGCSISIWLLERKKITHNFGSILSIALYLFVYALVSPMPWVISSRGIDFNVSVFLTS
jgi:uncharacterized integral membrane protein